MKPSRVVSVVFVLVLSAAVASAQHGAGVGSFPRASVTSRGNFPAASATSMGHLPPWTFNNGFGFGTFNNGFGGFNNGAAGFNSGFGNFQTGFAGFNNASRGHFRKGFWPGWWGGGGYGYGYYAVPVVSDIYGGSFYDDVNSRMNDRSNPDPESADQAGVQQYAVQPQQAAPAQPIVFIVDRDGNMRPYDYSQGKRSANAPTQAENRPPTIAQPTVEDIKTVLVYRDGHRREVTNYAIMGNKIYLSPHGTVPLSDLDIPATVAANDERGIDFRVPSATP